MIDPRNGYMALRKPNLGKKSKLILQDKSLINEMFKPSRTFEVLAVDPSNGLGLLAGDMVYLSPDAAGQVIELVEDGLEMYIVSAFAIMGVAQKVNRKTKPKETIDPAFKDAEPLVKTGPNTSTLIMGQGGKS